MICLLERKHSSGLSVYPTGGSAPFKFWSWWLVCATRYYILYWFFLTLLLTIFLRSLGQHCLAKYQLKGYFYLSLNQNLTIQQKEGFIGHQFQNRFHPCLIITKNQLRASTVEVITVKQNKNNCWLIPNFVPLLAPLQISCLPN